MHDPKPARPSPSSSDLNHESLEVNEVVLVGHCGPDQFLLHNAVRRALPSARIESAKSDETLDDHRHSRALWLVNRVLDGSFRASDGIELIRHESSAGDASGLPRLMLVSDLPEAQSQAEEVGALPGFGKRAVYASETVAALQDAVASATK